MIAYEIMNPLHVLSREALGFCYFSVLVSCTSCKSNFAKRNLHPSSKDTDEQLLERVKANLRAPRV